MGWLVVEVGWRLLERVLRRALSEAVTSGPRLEGWKGMIARTRKKLFQAEEREQDAWKLGAFKDQKETTGVKLLWRDGELGMRGLRSHMGRSWKDDRPWKRKLGFYFQPNRTFGGFQPGESCDGIDVFQGDSGCSVKNGFFGRQGRSLGDQ